jgi:PDZ domain/Carboxypeptidase regulatory-like domain
VVTVGAVLLCAFGLVAGRRCQTAGVPATDPTAIHGDLKPPSSGLVRFKCRLWGRVVDGQGRPISGAELVFALRTAGFGIVPVLLVRSDTQGRVAVDVGLAGTYHLLLGAPGKARLHRRIRLERSGTLDLGILRLQSGFAVSGRVTDPDGKPISHAQIAVIGTLDLPHRPLEPPHPGAVDDKGRFRVPGLQAMAYQLLVRADGFGSSVLRRVVAPAVGVRITLRPLQAITGRVMADDKPAPGATVELAGSGVWPPVHTQTDGQGRFRFTGLREGIYELRARRGRWVSAPAPAVDLLGGDSPPPVELTLLEGTVLRGRVVDARTRTPIGRVRITAGRDLLAMNPLMAQTTVDGSFVLEPLLPGEYRLTLFRDDYLPRRGVPVTVLPGPNPPLELALHRGGVLSGTVIDDTGRAVVGARIEVVGRARGSYIADRSGPTVALQDTLWDRALRSLVGGGIATADASSTPAGSLGVLPGPVPLMPAMDSAGDLTVATGRIPLSGRATAFLTDDKGHFRIAGVPPGSLSLVVRHESYARAKAGPWRLKRGEVRGDLVIRMGPGASLAGTVLDPEGVGLAGVQVALAQMADPFHYVVRITDDKGRFRVNNLTGRVRLGLSSPGFVPLVHRLRVGKPNQTKKVVLTLQRADCAVRGRLVDGHGLPVMEARLSLVSVTPDAPSRSVAVSDPQGGFTVSGLGKLSYSVTVHHHNFPDHSFEVRCPVGPRTWKMSYGGGVAFEVRDRQTRALLPAFSYVLRRAGGPVIRREGFAGRAQEVPIGAGKYELVVTAPNYARVTQVVSVSAGRTPLKITRRRVVVYLELGGSVEGYVRDDRGLPVADALVKIAQVEGRTDTRGAFLLTQVSPGTHELVATHPERGAGKVTGVKVKPGLATVSVVVDLTSGAQAPRSLRAGIPITLREKDDRILIATVTPRSSAETAGLAVGDELVAVDGQDTDGLGLSDVRTLLLGPSGTAVVLEIERNGKTQKRSVMRELLSDD